VSSIAPVLLLDLDGVLNPFAAPVCPDGYLEREFFPAKVRNARLDGGPAPVGARRPAGRCPAGLVRRGQLSQTWIAVCVWILPPRVVATVAHTTAKPSG
jgi:hypothetical protein